MRLNLAAKTSALLSRALLALVFTLLATSGFSQIVLRLASSEGAEALKIQREAIKAFEVSHPGVEVRLEQIDYSQYFQKMLTEYAADAAPDVAMMGFERFQPLAKRGVLLPLDDLIASSPNFHLDQYYEPIVRVHRFEGKLYVLPRDIAPMGLIYYNKKLFDEAKIPYPDGSWTWDFKVRPELKEKDFLWVIQQLTKFDAKGNAVQWGLNPGWPSLLGDSFAACLGAKPLDDPQKPTKVLMDSPEMVKAYSLEADLMLNKKWVPTPATINATLSDGDHLFAKGQIAMMQGGIWEVPNLRNYIQPGQKDFFEWDIALFPAYKDGTRHFPSGGSGYSIFSSTKHPKEAWELVQFLSGPETMKRVAAAGLAQPAIKSLALSEPWLVGPNTPIASRYPPSRDVTDKAVPYVVFAPPYEYWPDLQTYINPQLDLIWLGSKTPGQALKDATKNAQERLDTLNEQRAAPPFNWTYGLLTGVAIALALAVFVYWPERNRPFTAREKAESRAAYKFLAPWLIGLVGLVLGPMILSFLMSWADWDMILPAKFRGFGNYSEALTTDPRFWISLKVTFVYAIFSVPSGIFLALMLALLLNVRVKGMPLFRTFFYLPSLASTVASVLIWQRLFQQKGGLINMIIYGSEGHGNFLGLASLLKGAAPPGQPVDWLGSEHTALASLIIFSLWGIGGGMVILLAGLQGIPDFYYEAAMLDGANAYQKFRAVTLPLLTPALFFVLVTGVIGSFQVFTQAFVMTAGGPGDSTRFFMLHLYDQAFQALRMGYASALAWLLFFVILAFTFVQFRLSKWVYSEGQA